MDVFYQSLKTSILFDANCGFQAITRKSILQRIFIHWLSEGGVTRIHISEILYSVIFPKYYSCVSLII